jgi:hypothetical protein
MRQWYNLGFCWVHVTAGQRYGYWWEYTARRRPRRWKAGVFRTERGNEYYVEWTFKNWGGAALIIFKWKRK